MFVDFLLFLDAENSGGILSLGLAKFKIEMLEASGLALQFPIVTSPSDKIFFNSYKGGFFNEVSVASGLPVSSEAWQLFLKLKDSSFESLKNLEGFGENSELQSLLSQFIEYQLERKIKSEKYL